MIRRCLLITLLLLAATGSTAHAVGPELSIADDRVVLQGPPQQAGQAVAAWKALGIDTVRMFVQWKRVAPSLNSSKQPAGFHPSNPNDPKYDFAPVDAAVSRVRAAGMKVMLTITGPGPLWTSSKPSLHIPAYQPDADKFGAFATAVAKRYKGRVERYILWNEPNEPATLYPQSNCNKHHVCTPVAPNVYRNLVRAAYPAIKAADPGVPVLIGALAPRGQSSGGIKSVISPLTFVRDMGCVNSKFRSIRSGMCKGFKPATGDGFAYHPYGVNNLPDQPFPDPNDIDLASLPRLESALDKLQGMGALLSTTSKMGLYLDEYGYQTDPPDKTLGVTPAEQDRYLQQGAYLAWRDPRVKLFSQYIWIDEPLPGKGDYSGFQSGLRYANGTAKPSLAHFATPIFYDSKRKQLWGQERPGDKHTVTVQRRNRGSSTWSSLVAVITDARGYWATTVKPVTGAVYRFVDGSVVSGTTQ
jgi:Cellulase (glycosyl hydrolase family 5)